MNESNGRSDLYRVDEVLEAPAWNRELARFDDANLYQTWSREDTRPEARTAIRVALKNDSEVVALAQARVVGVPWTPLSLAYVRWGPVWQTSGTADGSPSAFRTIIRSLHRELVVGRGMALRILPKLYQERDADCGRALLEEGFTEDRSTPPSRTLVMDLEPDPETILAGVHHKWRYHYRKALKRDLEIVHGIDDRFFDEFLTVYAGMKELKTFLGDRDVRHTRDMQPSLPDGMKSRVFLCRLDGAACAGGIVSTLGDMALYIHGATNREGRGCYASYLVHWHMLQWVRSQGCRTYDLNGFSKASSGTYQFKKGLGKSHGTPLTRMGAFEIFPNSFSRAVFRLGQRVRGAVRSRRRAR